MIEANMKTYIASPIPFITPKNKLKRLEFAKRYVSKPASFWRNVLWAGESSFEFHASQKKVFVRINKNYRKKIAPVCQRVSHGGGSVMFWGSVSYNGVGDLKGPDRNKHVLGVVGPLVCTARSASTSIK